MSERYTISKGTRTNLAKLLRCNGSSSNRFAWIVKQANTRTIKNCIMSLGSRTRCNLWDDKDKHGLRSIPSHYYDGNQIEKRHVWTRALLLCHQGLRPEPVVHGNAFLTMLRCLLDRLTIKADSKTGTDPCTAFSTYAPESSRLISDAAGTQRVCNDDLHRTPLRSGRAIE